MREFTHKDVSIPKTLKSSSKLDTVSLTVSFNRRRHCLVRTVTARMSSFCSLA